MCALFVCTNASRVGVCEGGHNSLADGVTGDTKKRSWSKIQMRSHLLASAVLGTAGAVAIIAGICFSAPIAIGLGTACSVLGILGALTSFAYAPKKQTWQRSDQTHFSLSDLVHDKKI